MSKKRVWALAFKSVVLASLLVTIILVDTTSANMYFPDYGGTDSPIVSFISPLANQTFDTRNVPLTFTVTGVSSDYPVRYSLDGNTRSQFYGSRTVSETLSGLSEGQHKIEVSILYKQVSQLSIQGRTIPQVTTSELVKSVSFTVESSSPSPSSSINPTSSSVPSPSPSPSPTLLPTIEPTVAPTSTPKHQTGFLGTTLPVEYGYVIVAVLVIAVTAGVSLVYLKKIRK